MLGDMADAVAVLQFARDISREKRRWKVVFWAAALAILCSV